MSRTASTTWAPARTISRAVMAPMPLLAPVITTVRPLRPGRSWALHRWVVTTVGSGANLVHDALGDVATEGVHGVARIHAQRRGQDRGVGDVQAVHVPGTAARIDHVALRIAAERAPAHRVTARDLDTLLTHQVKC